METITISNKEYEYISEYILKENINDFKKIKKEINTILDEYENRINSRQSELQTIKEQYIKTTY